MRTVFLLLLLAPSRLLVAQGQSVVELTRVATPIQLDGDMSDAAWSGITPLPLSMYSPTAGGTPSERTAIRVAYDDQYLYAGGWFFDSRPQEIRVNSLYRDRWSGDDAFAVLIDPFNDNETGLWFMTNSAERTRPHHGASGFNTDRDQPGSLPSLPMSNLRILRLKLTHTFIPW